MKCEECGRSDARRCVSCGRVSCRDHGTPGCPTCGTGVATAPARRPAEAGVRATAPAAAETNAFCPVCGEPTEGACSRCGRRYCPDHLLREVTAEGERPAVCWNCRLTENARAVLFWVVMGALGLGALIYFFSLWM